MKRFTQAAMALALSLSVPAMAETNLNSPTNTEAGKPHVGVVLGYGDITGETKGAFNYGVDAGYQISRPWSLGLQVNTMKSDLGASGADLRRWSILPKVTYNFGGDQPVIKSSFIGAKFGAVIDRISVGGDGENTSRFGLAPVIGFDEPIAENWTAGVELSYLFVFGPEMSNDSLHALGALKYWF